MQEVLKMMYILVETDDTSSISSPLKTTNRIKFLSFAASENYLIFGASSGGLYVYNRQTFVFKTLVPGKEGSVTCVKVSPDEKWFGFATSRGISCVVEHNGVSVNRRILSHVHEGRLVTALQWSNSSNQLYVGDNTGQISVISVASYLTPAVALMQLDSSIIQLDTCSYMLVASSMTRSYLCDTFREQYRQIGTRLRDGEYGACFYHVDSHEPHFEPPEDGINPDQKDSHRPYSSLNDGGQWLLTDKNLQNVKLFCARPGLRLWEVRIDGAVMSTHQFKQLRSTAPTSVVRPPAVQFFSDAFECSPENQLLQFTKLAKVSQKYLITYDSNALCVLDPMTSDVILWTDQFRNISDVYVVGEIIYIWLGDSRLHAVSLTPIDKFLVRMYLQKQYFYCAQFCAAHVNILKKLVNVSLKMHVLGDLLQKIQEEGAENSLDESIFEKVKDLLDEVSKNTRNQEQAQMLNSGIFIVGNAHLLSQRLENENVRCLNHNASNQKILDSMDFFPNLIKRPELSTTGDSDGDSMSRIFRKSILPTMSSLPSQSDANSDEDFDPFPDLPLSSLTSAETIMALKNLTTTVSGTISNSTKSLREKWQTLEEKFRGQEEGGLSVEKSINRYEVGSSIVSDIHDDDEETITKIVCKKKVSTLPVTFFIEKCHQVTSHETDNCMSHQELEIEMFDSFAILYSMYIQSCKTKSEKNIDSLSEVPENVINFKKWLNSSDLIPFPFYEHFDEEFVMTLKCLFQNSVRSGTLTKWVSQFLSHIELDYNLFPLHIGRIHCKDSLLLDQALGRTLLIFCGLLEPHTALQNLDVSGSPCQYFSWNVIMECFQNSPAAASISCRVEEDSQGWPLPRVLNAMLVMLQLGQVDSCRNIGIGVPIKHVLRTVQKLEEEQAKIFKLFLLYLEKMSSAELFAVLKDPEIYYYTRYAFESLHKTDPECNCDCGFPLTEVQYSKLYQNVGKILLSHVFETEDPSEAMSICLKTGVLWYHFLVLRRKDPVEEVLPLIIHVACVEELRHRRSELTVSMWDLLLQLRIRLGQGHCLQCNTKLKDGCTSPLMPWTSLASLLLQETNIDGALALLSKYSHLIPAGSLNLQFYQSCLLASIVENLNAGLKKGFLDILTASNEMPVISPKLASSLDLPHSQEQHHWGLKLRLSESHCFRCLLPLTSAPGGPVVGFQCHHSFHSVCLQQQLLKLCPICEKL